MSNLRGEDWPRPEISTFWVKFSEARRYISNLELRHVEAKASGQVAGHPLTDQAASVCANAFNVIKQLIVAAT